MPRIAQHVAQRLDYCALTGPRHSRDADAQSLPRKRQQPLQYPLSLGKMTGIVAFDQGDRPGQRHAAALTHPGYVIILRKHQPVLRLQLPALDRRIEIPYGRIRYPFDAPHDAAGKLIICLLRHPVWFRNRIVFCHCFFLLSNTAPTKPSRFRGRCIADLYPSHASSVSSLARSISKVSSLIPASGILVPGAKIATAPCS